MGNARMISELKMFCEDSATMQVALDVRTQRFFLLVILPLLL